MNHRVRLVAAVLGLLGASMSLAAQQRVLGGAGGGGWLDAPPANWNTPGMRVPRAMSAMIRPEVYNACLGHIRRAVSAVDRLIDVQGWTLIGTREARGPVTVETATLGLDDTCRPLAVQAFVFIGTQLAGTLMPTPVEGDSDGSLIRTSILASGEIVAEFARYQPGDIVSRPHASSVVRYRIDRTDTGPLLVPGSATTTERSDSTTK